MITGNRQHMACRPYGHHGCHTCHGSGGPVLPGTRRPPAHPGKGAQFPVMHVLDEVEALVHRYLVLPAPHHYPALALWAAHTYGFARWDSTPRVAFMAPEKDCGKSRALELLEALCADARIVAGRAGISLAGIRQYINAGDTPTILVDEIDTVFGGGRSHEDLRGFINSGYRRKTGVVVRAGARDEGAVFYTTFAPVAMAGLSAGSLPDTVTSRTLMIRMRRALPHEHVDDLDDADPAECEQTAKRLGEWVTGQALDRPAPVPAEVRNRARQIWKPLLQLAAGAGDAWVQRAQDACLQFVHGTARRDRPSLGTQILTVIRDMFTEASDTDFLPTDAIIARLDAEYSITQAVGHKKLGVELAEYDITPTQRRLPGGIKRGYEKHRFTDAFTYYLPPQATTASVPQQQATATRHITPSAGQPATAQVSQ